MTFVPLSEEAGRPAVVAEALSWVGTPYVHSADIKGAGVDCAMLPRRVFIDAGVVEPFDPRPYPSQWHLHEWEERYLGWVLCYAHEVEGPPNREPLPADVVLFKFGHCYAHSAIVVKWPKIVHIHMPHVCGKADLSREMIGRHALGRLPMRFFSVW